MGGLHILNKIDCYEHVLILDDDEDLCKTLGEYLLESCYSISLAHRPSDAFKLLQVDQSINLILIDIMLPEQDGFSVCKQIRQEIVYPNIPIIMLTARSNTTDCIVGLEVGADDYITKPFEPRELLARVRSLMRREITKYASYQEIPTKGLYIENGTYQVWLDNEKIQLTFIEYKLLEMLISAPTYTVVSREDISILIYGKENSIYSRSIDALIKRLREKLHDNPHNPRFIKTIRGIGYCYIKNT